MKARDLFELARRHGWQLDHVTGSHHIFCKEGHAGLSIPGPANRECPGPLVAAIIKRIKEEPK